MFYGQPGPSTTPIQEIVNTFVFPDMITKFCRGMALEDAVKWGVGEYRRMTPSTSRQATLISSSGSGPDATSARAAADSLMFW